MEFRNAGLSAGAAMKITKNIMEGVRSMKEPTPLPLTDFILEKDNPAVEACMKRLLKNKSANREKTIDDDPRWRQKTQEFCFQNKISYSSMKPPVEFDNSPWFNALPHREQESIIAHHIKHAREDESTSRLSVKTMDANYCISRTALRTDGVLATLMPNARVCMSGPDIEEGFRVLSGLEALSIQGMDATLLAKYAASSGSLDTDQLFRDMAGNAFAGPIAVAFVISILCQSQQHDEEDVSALILKS